MNVLVSLFSPSLHIGGKETSSYIQRTVRITNIPFSVQCIILITVMIFQKCLKKFYSELPW